MIIVPHLNWRSCSHFFSFSFLLTEQFLQFSVEINANLKFPPHFDWKRTSHRPLVFFDARSKWSPEFLPQTFDEKRTCDHPIVFFDGLGKLISEFSVETNVDCGTTLSPFEKTRAIQNSLSKIQNCIMIWWPRYLRIHPDVFLGNLTWRRKRNISKYHSLSAGRYAWWFTQPCIYISYKNIRLSW